LSIHRGDRLAGAVGGGHHHERKTARTAGLAIHHQSNFCHFADLRESLL
jgi:hypothetical protein